MTLSRLYLLASFICLLIVSNAAFAGNSLPAYWQLNHKNGTTLTVLGSIHLGHDGLYPLPGPLMQAFQQANQLIVEVDTTAISAKDKTQAANIIRLPIGQRLPDVLSNQDWQALQQAANDLRVDLTHYYGFQPWFVMLNLMQSIFAKQGYLAEKGIDEYFISLANEQSMPILQFETLPQQMRLLQEVAALSTAPMSESLKQLDQITEITQQSLQAWQRGDLDKLAQLLLTLDDMPPGSPSYQLMLTNRNQAWAEAITQLPSNQHYFIVVGALHLTGPDSMIRLLSKVGYQVKKNP